METQLTGRRLLAVLNQMDKNDKPPSQPMQCRGCIWGKWDGLKQFCPWRSCKRNAL